MALKISDDEAKRLGIDDLIPKRASRATNLDERGMNKTEAKYARRLDDRIRECAIRRYWFESVKFRLADRCWYTPDFLVEWADGHLSVHETKGAFIREDGWIKLKVAAEHIPLPFFLAQWIGGEWEITRIKGRGTS